MHRTKNEVYSQASPSPHNLKGRKRVVLRLIVIRPTSPTILNALMVEGPEKGPDALLEHVRPHGEAEDERSVKSKHVPAIQSDGDIIHIWV